MLPQEVRQNWAALRERNDVRICAIRRRRRGGEGENVIFALEERSGSESEDL